MKPMWLALLLAVFSGTVAPALSAQSANDGAASYPSKPVRWVIGGSSEAAAKFVREEAGRIRGLLQAGVLKQE